MSAVPELLFAPPGASVLPWLVDRQHDVAPFGTIDRVAVDDSAATRVEILILERCADQIAAEAGADAKLLPFAGHASRQADILERAIERLDTPCLSARPLVYVAAATTATLPPDRLIAVLHDIARAHSSGALLAIAVPIASEPLRQATAPGDTPGHACSVARFHGLAHAAGWEPCQLWTDAQARFAIHVLERPGSH